MLNERIKMAESIDTVHTHTHTHTIFLQTKLVDGLELYFSEIEYGIINHGIKKIAKYLYKDGFILLSFLLL